MPDEKSLDVLRKILDAIELPEEAYEKAEMRYNDLDEWLQREDSSCGYFDPHVFLQGSFRLGTANRPYKNEEYDLDMGCNLRQGLTKDKTTQEQLKQLVGKELEDYRIARNIKKGLAEKKRCWRLKYADDLSFHMDIVPCIPESDDIRDALKIRMVETTQLEDDVAQDVSEMAVSITDNTDQKYRYITRDWRISNPEGYARWFATRMRTASAFLAERELLYKASINTIPYYKWKTPLQLSVQLLKRHRDIMFKNAEECKPISVIITTLAAHAYRGESDVVTALSNILDTMEDYIQGCVPLVPNPVNPAEDFADKWYSPKHSHLRLKDNFFRWLIQARAHFKALLSKESSQIIIAAAKQGFAVELDEKTIESLLGLSATTLTPNRIDVSAPKPWFKY